MLPFYALCGGSKNLILEFLQVHLLQKKIISLELVLLSAIQNEEKKGFPCWVASFPNMEVKSLHLQGLFPKSKTLEGLSLFRLVWADQPCWKVH